MDSGSAREKIASQPDLFGTKQAAQILGVPDWRIKNFSEGTAYRLPPSVQVGSGRGSRRLYSVSDLYRMAIANELVLCGFTPEAIGGAMHAVPDSALNPIETTGKESKTERQGRSALFLVQHAGQWRVLNAEPALTLAKRVVATNWRGHFFVLALRPVFEEVPKRKNQYSGREW